MAASSTRSATTNAKVAKAIGVTHAAVSRLRSGARTPSRMTMSAINRVYGWSIGDQAEAAMAGNYAQELERHLKEHYQQ